MSARRGPARRKARVCDGKQMDEMSPRRRERLFNVLMDVLVGCGGYYEDCALPSEYAVIDKQVRRTKRDLRRLARSLPARSRK